MKIFEGFETEDALGVVLVVLLLLEHLAYGGNRVDVSLWFSLLQTALLAIALLTKDVRADLAKLNGWWTLTGLFLLLLLGVGSALAPLGVEQIGAWTSVGREPIAAVDPLGVFVEISKVLGLASVFTLASIICVRRRRAQMLMKSLIVSGLVFGLICLVLEGLSPVYVLNWAKPVIAQGRVSGLFSSANTAATAFGLYAILATGGVLRIAERSKSSTFTGVAWDLIRFSSVEFAAFLISIGCLLLSSSRGGIAAFAPSLALLLIWRSYKGGLKGPALALAGLALALVLLSGGLAIDRYQHAAVMRDQRLEWDLAAWRLFLDAPFHGYGLGSLALMFKAEATPHTYWTLGWAGAAHNILLQWLAEGGLMATIPLVALIAFIIDSSLLGLTEEDPGVTWRRTLLACAVFVALHSLVEYSLQEPSIAALFSVLLGAGVGFSSQRRLQRRGRHKDEERLAGHAPYGSSGPYVPQD